TVDHDLGDAAYPAGDDRAAAGHRLEIDDAEWLVDRWAAEDRRVAVKLDLGLEIEHLRDPGHIGVQTAGLSDAPPHLRGDLRRVGLPGGQDHRDLQIELPDGANEMDDPLLADHPTHKEHIGT